MKKIFKRSFYTAVLIGLFTFRLSAQTGLSVSPPRVFFSMDAGNTLTKKVTVSNISNKTSLDIAVSLGDWEYNNNGDNVVQPAGKLANSAANWVSIKKEDTYFTLKAGEQKEIEVSMTAAQELNAEIPVHTAMLYFTQMNPINDVNKSTGALLKVSVRSGIKLFQRPNISEVHKIDIQNLKFNKEKNQIELYFNNQSNIWEEGKIYADVLNTSTGKKSKLNNTSFFSIPGDNRQVNFTLPKDFPKGNYVVNIILDIGNENSVEMAELTFDYEK